ncbi:MAG: hypothetical protein Q8S84_01495 [bacterium]|nr:hypothetical protein [bacterium]
MSSAIHHPGLTVKVFAILSQHAHHTGVISVVPADSVVIVVHTTVATAVFELV